ncbi:MAG: hypothetical protein ACREPK_06135 [Rhodanobacteraceae bacterium]
MGSTNYIDLEQTRQKLGQAIDVLARNAVQLAGALKEHPYPAK